VVCCHHYQLLAGCDEAFRVDGQSLVFGPGCLAEAGAHAASLGLKRVGLFTDKRLSGSDHVGKVRKSLKAAGIDVALYDDVAVEPTDESFQAAAAFAQDTGADGFVSVGGGSVIDTFACVLWTSASWPEWMPWPAGKRSSGRRPNTTFWPVRRDAAAVGTVTSAVHSPRLERNIALAMVAADCSEIGAEVEVAAPSGAVRATVAEKPFFDPKKRLAGAPTA